MLFRRAASRMVAPSGAVTSRPSMVRLISAFGSMETPFDPGAVFVIFFIRV